jgi:hypothetical protein
VGEKVGENIKELQEEDEKERGRNRSGGRKVGQREETNIQGNDGPRLEAVIHSGENFIKTHCIT